MQKMTKTHLKRTIELCLSARDFESAKRHLKHHADVKGFDYEKCWDKIREMEIKLTKEEV